MQPRYRKTAILTLALFIILTFLSLHSLAQVKDVAVDKAVKAAIPITVDEQKPIMDYQNQINMLNLQIENLQLKQRIAIREAADAHNIKLTDYDFGQVGQGLGFNPKAAPVKP